MYVCVCVCVYITYTFLCMVYVYILHIDIKRIEKGSILHTAAQQSF